MSGPVFNPKPSQGAEASGPNQPVPSPGPVFHPEKPIPILATSADVVGKGDLINGVYGGSKKQTGVVGESETFAGVSGDGPVMGVWGTSQAGDGVVGNGRRGVVGESPTFQGVFGHSTENAG